MFLIQAAGAARPVEHPQTTFHPVTEFGELLNDVFANTFWWTMIILVIVIVATLFVAIRYRERPGTPQPKAIHGNTILEITWTLIPAIIVILISIPTVRAVFATQQKPPAEALTIEVIGHQWWWEYRYPEQGVVTANELWVPTGRPIHLVMHSADVIHSYWIPRFGGKRDVNPVPRGREGEKDKRNHLLFTVRETGNFSGQCAEFCGESHAIMRATARAVAPEEFDAWVGAMKAAGTQPIAPMGDAPAMTSNTNVAGLATDNAGGPVENAAQAGAQPQTAGVQNAQNGAQNAQNGGQPAVAQAPKLSLGTMPAPNGMGNPVRPEIPTEVWAEEGKRIFMSKPCIVCHTIAGTTAAGVLGPNLTRFGARPFIGAGAVENNLKNLEHWIYDPQSLKPGTLMPGAVKPGGGQPPTRLSRQEAHAIAQYLLSLK